MERKVEYRPYLCMGLSRMFGGALGVFALIFVFDWLNTSWNLGVHQIIDIQTVGGKAYGALAIAGVAGFIAAIIGQGIGASIKVRNDNLAAAITAYWHYTANHVIAWFLTIPVGFTLLLGKENVKVFFTATADTFMYLFFALAMINGVLVCLIITISGNMMSKNNPFGLLLARLGPIIVSAGCCSLIFLLYELPPYPGIVIGIVLPFILIPICANMWRKDMTRRDPHGRY
ncbi:MAG: hypothetical protein NT085_00260 [candidate division SR1 bacterium]|nr:hypothetical protein [candidate division SR1 bacterium]